ncbi:PhnP protein [Gluconobacter morbifer G707]|uniref:PhnP protein n=2 Tax=Gluconobacter TaxID=441 RepID=G6XI58_9PROT|nr:PhnP protein [Gluconobacter morbifer G707]
MIGGGEGLQTGIWGSCDPQEPRNRRTRTSAVLESENGFRLLVDSGPDFRHQMLACGLSHVHGVIYTHAHGDHIGGLDELRAVNRVIESPLPLFAAQDVMDELRLRYAYAFAPWKGPDFYRPVFDETIVRAGDVIPLPEMTLRLFEQQHGRITSLGIRVDDFAYSTDVDTLSEDGLMALTGIRTWVVDCFQHEPHPAHAWVQRVLEWRDRIGCPRTILTHMGPEMDYRMLCQTLPADVEPAYDGMVLDL